MENRGNSHVLDRRVLLRAAVMAVPASTSVTAQAHEAVPAQVSAKARIVPNARLLGQLAGEEGDIASTGAYAIPGNGGGARYILVRATRPANSHWDKQSATAGLVWRLHEPRPDVSMFGAVGDGQADDTAALQAGLDYLASRFDGGDLLLLPLRYRVSRLTLPKGTAILGTGGVFSTHYPETLNKSAYALLLDRGGGITMLEGSSLRGIVMHPHGMTFPQDNRQVSAWQGTAITIAPNSAGTYIGACMIVGFEQAIIADGTGPIFRPRMEDLSLDCHNGISLSAVPDIAYLSRIHAWNFGSTGRGGNNVVSRPGVGFRLTERADWAKLTDCFCYGYEIGFELKDVADCTLTGCGADHKPGRPDEASSVGFKLHGRARNNRLIGCQAAAQGCGIHLMTNADEPMITNHMQGCSVWDNLVGVEIDAGHVSVSDLASRVRGGLKLGPQAAGGRLSGLSFEHIAEPRIDAMDDVLERFIRDKPLVIG